MVIEGRGVHKSMRLAGLVSTEDLLSRQSVRATFRLPSETIQAIRIVVTQLGIKPKSLFDYLLEDREAIKEAAPGLQHARLVSPERIQKTFVISRKSLSFLDQVANHFNAPRDVLVENLVRQLIPLIEDEKKKHRARKKILEEVRAHFESGKSLLDGLGRSVGRNDPFYNSMLSAMSSYNSLFTICQ